MSGFRWVHERRGVKLAGGRVRNTVCVEGLERYARAYLGDYDGDGDVEFPETPIRGYVGLIDEDGFTSVSYADTVASHGWSEVVDVTAATRPIVDVSGAPPNNALTGLVSYEMVWEATASVQVRGFFTVLGNDVLGNFGSGLMWNAAALASPVAMEPGDTLKLIYELQTSVSI